MFVSVIQDDLREKNNKSDVFISTKHGASGGQKIASNKKHEQFSQTSIKWLFLIDSSDMWNIVILFLSAIVLLFNA